MSADQPSPAPRSAPVLSVERLPPALRTALLASRTLIVLTLAGLAVAHGVQHTWRFTIDDAGISYAYARHIAQGRGPVAVVGAAVVEGYSNPLWVLILTPFAAWDSVQVVAKALGVLLFAAALLLGWRLLGLGARRRWYDLGWEGLLVVVSLAWVVTYVAWVPAGLENALYSSGLVGLACLDAWELGSPRRRSWSGLLALAVALTRPEGVAYGLAYGALKALHALVRRERRAQALGYAALFGLPLLGYHLVHYLVFLDAVPNTFYAKARSEDAFGDAWKYLKKEGGGTGYLYLLPLAAVGLFRDARVKLGLLAQVGIATLFLFYSGGDWMPYGRFLSFGMPAVALLAASGLYNLAWLLAYPARRFISPEVFTALAVIPLTVFWHDEHARSLARIEKKPRPCHLCRRIGDVEAIEKARKRLELPTATLLTHDFGGPAWMSSEQLHPLDLLGLCDHTFAKYWQYRNGGQEHLAMRVRYQYAFHEQGQPPTLLFFPPNFWRALGQSPEFEQGYFHVSRRVLSRPGLGGYVWAVHRSAFVDFMPPVERFDFEDVGKGLILLGSRVLAEDGRLVLSVSLLRDKAKAALPSQVRAVARSGGKAQTTKPRRLFPDGVDAKREWTAGEPRRLDIPLPALQSVADLELQVREGRKWVQVPLGVFDPKGDHAPGPFVDHYFPDNLPAARDPELAAVEPAVRHVVDRRFRVEDQTAEDEALGERLVEMGERLEAAGSAGQAYLAYVWATSADRSLARRLHRRLDAIRPVLSNVDFTWELALLRRAYATRAESWLLRLAALYAQRGEKDKARYFAERIREPSLRKDAKAALAGTYARRAVPRGVPGISSDFEAPGLVGWRVSAKAFGSGPLEVVADETTPIYRGHGGSHVLAASWSSGARSGGSASSKEFEVDAGTLSLAVASHGGGADVALMVGGKAVRTAKGSGSRDFEVVFWDIEEYRGKRASLRVRRSRRRRDFVAIDDLRLWD